MKLNKNLIAPCGMNCGICIGYLRKKNSCPGCRLLNPDTSKYFRECKMRNCDFFKDVKAEFCFECDKFPCLRLRNLDKRYRTKYNMSMIDNLNNIKDTGIKEFIKSEEARWSCPTCDGTICVHRKYCLKCENTEKIKKKEVL